MKKELKQLAELIWKYGETKTGQCGFDPENEDYPKLLKNGFTHFDLKWKERGISVELNLYKAEAYGAVREIGEPFKHIIIINDKLIKIKSLIKKHKNNWHSQSIGTGSPYVHGGNDAIINLYDSIKKYF